MGRFVADQNKVLFLYESGLYASPTGLTGQWFGVVTNHDIVDSTNVESIRYLGGGNRNVDIHVDGPLDHEGTLVFHPQDWKSLTFTLGSTLDGGAPTPFTHDISESDSNDGNAFTSGTLCPFISFTVEDSQGGFVAGSNFIRTANGCIVDSWEMSASQGDIVEVNVGYVAQSVNFSSGASTAVTAITDRPFLWQDIKVHLPSGTVLQEVKDLTVSINNNLEKPHYLNGSREISVPIPMNRDYEISITLDADNEVTKTLYDQHFRGGSEFNMIVAVEDTTAGAGSRDLFMTFSGCKLTEMEAPSPNEGIDEQSLTIVPKTVSVLVEDLTQLYNPY